MSNFSWNVIPFVRVISGFCFVSLLVGSLFLSEYLFSILLLVMLAEILIFEWPRLAAANKRLWFLVPFYPVLPVLVLCYLSFAYRFDSRFFSVGKLVPLYPFLVCWVADSFAYIFGKLWGKHKICRSISPKKSWEGFFGGFFGVFLLHGLIYHFGGDTFFIKNIFVKQFFIKNILFALFFTTIAFVGDLFESYLKRRAGLKDSGFALPGHGGLLDRLDSVFFVGPVFLLFL